MCCYGEWLRSNQGNVRTMLANLGDVLWAGHAYKCPGLNDLIAPAAVRKCYHKVRLYKLNPVDDPYLEARGVIYIFKA